MIEENGKGKKCRLLMNKVYYIVTLKLVIGCVIMLIPRRAQLYL